MGEWSSFTAMVRAGSNAFGEYCSARGEHDRFALPVERL